MRCDWKPTGDTRMLEMKHITKRFPGVVALNDISLSLKSGEVHALVGENGAVNRH